MRIVSSIVGRSIADCWRGFANPNLLVQWVPGLRSALALEIGEGGLPREVQFEFVGGLQYTLVYTYDPAARVVRWEPRVDPGADTESSGVRGFARFEEHAEGTLVTYALEHAPGRKAAERAIDDPQILVDAFARMMMHGT